jgi:hypothetical protein
MRRQLSNLHGNRTPEKLHVVAHWKLRDERGYEAMFAGG